MSELPRVHPAVVERFVRGEAREQIALFPVNLDVKQTEIVRTLFVDPSRSRIAANPSGAIPVFLSTDPQLEAIFCAVRPKTSIVVDLHDKGRKFDFVGLTDPMWQAVAEHSLDVIYLKLQVHDPAKYREINRLPGRVHVLSMPLLLGGSRFHVTIQTDNEGDALFSRVLKTNPRPAYEYDWSCIGSITSDDRKAAFEVLERCDVGKGFRTVSTPGHLDANVATVPYGEYLRISRASRISISLNGRGPWCLKDGELLANDCFVMRQWHPTIDLNPLTPRDGMHWAVFKTDELPATIERWLKDEQGRERIRAAGHAMFRAAMTEGLWARTYVDGLVQFLKTRRKEAWGKLAFA